MVKLLVFLPSNKNVNLLDEYCNGRSIPISKYEVSSLLSFVEIGISNLSHVDMLVADLEAFTDTDDDLITALQKFQVLYRETRIVILALGYEPPNELLRRIVEEKIDNIISATDSQLDKEIGLALSPRGMTERESSKYLPIPLEEEGKERTKFTFPKINFPKFQRKEKTIPKPTPKDLSTFEVVTTPAQIKREIISTSPSAYQPSTYTKKKGIITIGICGTQRRIGTTHQALMLSAYINSLGFKAAYLESNHHHSIREIEKYYHTTTNKAVGLTQFHGIDLFTGYQIAVVMALNYDVFIFDYGMLTELSLKDYLSSDIKLVVGGSKPWEIPFFGAVFDTLKENPELQFILSFTDENEQAAIKNMMGSYGGNTYFSEYAPSPFVSGVNTELYRHILSDYIGVMKLETRGTI